RQLRLFIDGKERAVATLDEPLEWGKRFFVGDPLADDANAVVTLSDFQVVESEPNPAAFLAALKASATPTLPFAGPPSPWYAEGEPSIALEALDPDVVLSPWEPVTWNDGKAGVWGRSYDFGSTGGLVAGITAMEKALLGAGGIQLLVGSPEARKSVELTPASVVSQHTGQVILKKEGQLDKTRVTSTARLEYDGMVWIELEIDELPRDGELLLSIPIQPEFAQYYHYIGAPHRYESQNLRRNSYSGALPEKEPLTLPFKTAVWIGNTHAGLMWFTESDENWWPLDREDCLVFRRQPDGSGVLDVRLIAKPLPDNAPGKLTYRFGLMATPVKPMPERWRSWTISAQYSIFQGEDRGSHVIYWPDQWRSIYLDPEPSRARNIERTRNAVRTDRKAGKKIIPYWTRIHAPISDGKTLNPDGKAMREAFSVAPDRPPGSTNEMIRVAATSGWSDYLVWAYDRWNTHLGEVDGWYLDETQPIPNLRKESGGGYETWDGKRRPTFEFLASRDLLKRISWLTEKKWGRQPQSIIHNSATYAMPYMSFFQTFLVGEQFNSGYFHPNPEVLPPADDQEYFYSYVLPMDRLIVEGFWRQWGVPIAWLGQLKNQKHLLKNTATARDFLSRVLQVDALYWPLFIHVDPIRDFHRIAKAYGIADSDTSFTPYWENRKILSNHPEIVCGYYENQKGWLVICSNLSREPQVAQLDLTALPESIAVHLKEQETDLALATDRSVEVKIPRNDYVLLQIAR
ncbi:MAG TPA: glycoside hydrolase domain-containing protein, partial [Chthoniobacteraceae bacterium]|nr:glycoside hydrolase domain-containing protein [Chthoniobacteraceae bacterium]